MASDTVRDLGVVLDSSGTMNAHISNVCRVASHSLWRIGRLRKFLDQSNTEKLIHVFVTSRLDYCNSLFLVYTITNLRSYNIFKMLLPVWLLGNGLIAVQI